MGSPLGGGAPVSTCDTPITTPIAVEVLDLALSPTQAMHHLHHCQSISPRLTSRDGFAMARLPNLLTRENPYRSHKPLCDRRIVLPRREQATRARRGHSIGSERLHSISTYLCC
ncbi:hypothetical protein CPAR01_03423 [Colletotrichum paranaense]|uniref:Uncharacterized protein n=1 Tax=Colletotrichum paranaense TaxID=1914294 RepID=A0ABQ9T2B4_9PEZI|nr:uncharacterized protein CPAR01_03423 [Colletotrichum paranaense]KAK1545921.1 hypothetical protein CPAR01_03423 [Colletotrichum paranaense]